MGSLILKELLQQSGINQEQDGEKFLYLFVGAKEYKYAGAWQWGLQCDAVFCSDVMLNLPAYFEGTKGIIHPDDKALVLERLSGGDAQTIPFLQFRIITTYGEIKLLAGRNLRATEITSLLSTGLKEPDWQTQEDPLRQLQKISWQKRAGELAERFTATGTWHYTVATTEVYYSDELFRIFGLPRQGLNAHLNTLTPFIHPDDRAIVSDTFGKALREQVPLHLDYRIVTPGGQEKTVRHTTHWEFNDNGGMMLYGIVQDITEQQAAAQKAQEDKYNLQLTNRLLQLHEQSANMGHWYINLVTRKTVYADNVYWLHGVKPGTLPVGGNLILDFVHPDDFEAVKEVQKKILQQHTPPDIQYRITRPDGKVRHFRQRGRLVTYGEGEMMMIVTLQDVTAGSTAGWKLAALQHQASVQQAVRQQSEEMAFMGTWVWEPETEAFTCSENLFALLGTKTPVAEPTQKHFTRAIHPEDREAFEKQLQLLLLEKRDVKTTFRIIRLGKIVYATALLRLISINGKEFVTGTLQDITVQAQLQQELALHQKQAASITENMLDRAIITDADNVIRVWNRCCEQVFNLKKEAVTGKNIFDVFPQLKNESDLSLFNRALAGETISLYAEKATVRREYHDLHMIPLRDEKDNVTGILHLLHDVTKEQKMQQRLNERLNFIESLLEASVDRILVMDRYMNYLYCNDKAAQFYRLRKEDIVGKNVLEVFPASVNDPTHEHFRKALKGDTVHIPAIEGFSEEHYFEVFLIPIKDESGAVSAVLWMHHNLSGEIKIQQQLRKADEILNTINAALVEFDCEARFQYLNPAAEQHFGKPKEALLNEVLWEAFPRLEGTEGASLVLKALVERRKAEGEYLSTLTGQWIFTSTFPSAGGGVRVLIYNRQDIKETELQLREEHRRLEDAQAMGKIGSFEWNLGEEDVAWTDEMYRINGLEPQSERITIGMTERFIHPEAYGDLKKLQEASFAAPGLYQLEHRIVLRDGTEKWVKHQFESTAGDHGNVVRVHGTVQDITERKIAGQEILRLKDEIAQKATG